MAERNFSGIMFIVFLTNTLNTIYTRENEIVNEKENNKKLKKTVLIDNITLVQTFEMILIFFDENCGSFIFYDK